MKIIFKPYKSCLKKAQKRDVVDFPKDMLVKHVGPYVLITNAIMQLFLH